MTAKFSNIFKGQLGDALALEELAREATKTMKANGIEQWHYNYPLATDFQADIREEGLYVYKDGEKILGTITLNKEQDEQYLSVNWQYRGEKILVIHRLAVHPKGQGRGIGKELCGFAESFAQANGYSAIRLDAYAGNPISCHLYEKLGYEKTEEVIYFHNNELPFYCYELPIKKGS